MAKAKRFITSELVGLTAGNRNPKAIVTSDYDNEKNISAATPSTDRPALRKLADPTDPKPISGQTLVGAQI